MSDPLHLWLVASGLWPDWDSLAAASSRTAVGKANVAFNNDLCLFLCAFFMTFFYSGILRSFPCALQSIIAHSSGPGRTTMSQPI